MTGSPAKCDGPEIATRGRSTRTDSPHRIFPVPSHFFKPTSHSTLGTRAFHRHHSHRHGCTTCQVIRHRCWPWTTADGSRCANGTLSHACSRCVLFAVGTIHANKTIDLKPNATHSLAIAVKSSKPHVTSHTLSQSYRHWLSSHTIPETNQPVKNELDSMVAVKRANRAVNTLDFTVAAKNQSSR